MKEREHFFFSVKLASLDETTYQLEVRWFGWYGLIVHCLFWLHTPYLVKTDDAGLQWMCRNCLLAAHKAQQT